MKITKYDLLNYLESRYDVTLKQIIQDLKIDNKNMDKIKEWLDELIKEKWIVIAKSAESGEFEYDPGEKLNYGGLRG